RVMPRQNEMVNEIWLCDKGRLAYHYMESDQRLEQPLVRKGGELVPAGWDEALNLVTEKLRSAGSRMVMLVGGRLSNEDLFNLGELTEAQGGQKLLYSYMGGGDLVSRFAPPKGSNLGELGAGSVVLVVACDLHQEAPLWWLRLKQAVKRGAKLIVASARPTRLDKFATHVVRYAYGEETRTVAAFLPVNVAGASQVIQSAAKTLTEAEDLIVIYGSDGLYLEESTALARTCAELLLKTNHTGKVNSGLLAAWQNGNLQGGWELGFRTVPDLAERLEKAALVWVAAADPAGDDPALAKAVRRTGFLVVQELFLTETARMADVVFPVLVNAEREGSYTSGERRVQRFYPALPPKGIVSEARPDFAIPALVGEKLGIELEDHSAALVMEHIAAKFAAFAGINYQRLAEVAEQWPPVGGSDLYYGGTSYLNRQGLGVTLSDVLQGESLLNPAPIQTTQRQKPSADALPVYPIQLLYDRGTTILPSALLHERLVQPAVWVHPTTAAEHKLQSKARLIYEGEAVEVAVLLSEQTPPKVALLPRSVGLLGYWLEA
ncbi:MAG: molybdopterin-dependent oxidoreductase, partial [Anaerolineales bacterium]